MPLKKPGTISACDNVIYAMVFSFRTGKIRLLYTIMGLLLKSFFYFISSLTEWILASQSAPCALASTSRNTFWWIYFLFGYQESIIYTFVIKTYLQVPVHSEHNQPPSSVTIATDARATWTYYYFKKP